MGHIIIVILILLFAIVFLAVPLKNLLNLPKLKSFKMIDLESIIEIIPKDPDFPKSLYTFMAITFATILILLLFGIGVIEIFIAFLIDFALFGFTYAFPYRRFEMDQTDEFQRITKIISFYILIICVIISMMLAITLPMFNVDFITNNLALFVLIPFGFLLIYFLLIGVFLLISKIYMGRKEEDRRVLVLRIFGAELASVGLIASFLAKKDILTIPIIGVALIFISILLEKVQKFREMIKEHS